jgi:hypothetical protein
MEHTGVSDKIQASHATYELLVAAGKASWAEPRVDSVHAKGKGVLRTFWITIHEAKAGTTSSTSGSSISNDNMVVTARVPSSPTKLIPVVKGNNFKPMPQAAKMKEERLVGWLVDLMCEHLRKLLAQRKLKSASATVPYVPKASVQTSLDEVAEVIHLPRFCEKTFKESDDCQNVKFDPQVLSELTTYVATIASHYQDNPFHNFEVSSISIGRYIMGVLHLVTRC